jgi:hypothetical protein
MQDLNCELLLYVKFVLRVDPYFQVLAFSLIKLSFKLVSLN